MKEMIEDAIAVASLFGALFGLYFLGFGYGF